MNVDELQPGRELDALVAEKVMGWPLGPPKSMHGYMMHGMVEVRLWEGSTVGGLTHTEASWQPSTDMSCAWRVIEKLQQETAMLSVSWCDVAGPGGPAWWCVIYRKGGPPLEGPYADSAPLAICRAALLSVQPA